jgi:hypothetical protein
MNGIAVQNTNMLNGKYYQTADTLGKYYTLSIARMEHGTERDEGTQEAAANYDKLLSVLVSVFVCIYNVTETNDI